MDADPLTPAAPPPPPPRALAAISVAAVLLGIALRLCFLGSPPVSHDEVFMLARAAGHSMHEAKTAASPGEVMSAGAIAAILRPGPTSGGALHVAASVAVEEPHHAPLHYVVAWAAARCGLESPAAQRGLVALVGVSIILAMALLAREITGDARAELAAAAVAALSPPFLSWSLEARPHLPGYAAAVWSSWLLARALRLGSRAAWAIYAISLAVVFHTYPAALPVLGAHAVLAALQEERARSLRAFALAAGAGLAACLPWIANMIYRRGTVRGTWGWVAADRDWPSLLECARRTFFEARLPWLDGGPALHGPISLMKLQAAVGALALAVIVAGAPRVPRRALAFAAALSLAAIAPFLLLDAVVGTHTTAIQRYLGVTLAGVDLLLALSIAGALSAPRPWVRALGCVSLAAVLAAGAGAGLRNVLAAAPPSHWPAIELRAAAAEIEAHPERLTICPDDGSTLLARAMAVAPEVSAARRLLCLRPGVAPVVPAAEAEVLVYGEPLRVEAALLAQGFSRAPDPPGARDAPLAIYRRAPR